MRRLLVLLVVLATLPAQALPMLAEQRLEQVSRVTWREGDVRFGGFSGLEIAPDGRSFLAISDRGSWARGVLDRDGDGVIRDARMTGIGALHGIGGEILDGDNVDAEGLAVDADGRAYVSFEAFHRVRRYDDIDGAARRVPSHRDFPRLQNNSGLEAIALDGDGVLHAIPERSGALSRPFPVYALRDGEWGRVFGAGIPRRGQFVVTDADFGPDGRLYVLERDFRWLGGFATRIRSFAPGPDGHDGPLTDEATLFESSFGQLDNMEGIDVRAGEDGRVRVTLISDDNFFPLQRTEFVEFRLVGN